MIRFIHAQFLRLLYGFYQQETGNGHPLRPGSIPIRLQRNVSAAGISLRRRVLRPCIRIRKRPVRLCPFQNIFLIGSGKNIPGNSHHAPVLKLQIHLRITDGHQHGYDGSAPVIRPNTRPGASSQAQTRQYGQYLYRYGHRVPFARTSYHIVPQTQPFFHPPLFRNLFLEKNMRKESSAACPPEGLTRSGKTHNLREGRKRKHAYQSPQKKYSVDCRHPGGPGHHVLPVLHASRLYGRITGILCAGRQHRRLLPGGNHACAFQPRLYGSNNHPGRHGILPAVFDPVPPYTRYRKKFPPAAATSLFRAGTCNTTASCA